MNNKELENIGNIITLLSIFKQYSLDSNNIYDDLKITTSDIDREIKHLQDIHYKYTERKKWHSENANKWNKEHKERHNETNKAYLKRKKEVEKIGNNTNS